MRAQLPWPWAGNVGWLGTTHAVAGVPQGADEITEAGVVVHERNSAPCA